MIILKRSMKIRLVAIFVVTIVIIIGVISLANVVLLPYFYQSNNCLLYTSDAADD